MAYFILILLFPINAYAYLDPSTGAMIIQLIFGGIAAGIVIIKVYWNKICHYIKINYNKYFKKKEGNSKEGLDENED